MSIRGKIIQLLPEWAQSLTWCLRVVFRAGQGRAGQGRAGQGRAGQGRAGQGRAGQGRAGQGRAARHSMASTMWKECDRPVPLEVDDSTHCRQAKHHLRANLILPPLQKGFQESFIVSCHCVSYVDHMSLYFHHARPVTTLSCTHLDVISALQVCSMTNAITVGNDICQP